MTRLVALYRQPADEAAFLAHYDTVHAPLVRAIPGLQAFEVRRVAQTLVGDAYFMVAEMRWADRASFDAAMRSPENRAAGEDVMSFAAGLVTLFVTDD
jgi:uncharacterized protein (TIGR02118 family)